MEIQTTPAPRPTYTLTAIDFERDRLTSTKAWRHTVEAADKLAEFTGLTAEAVLAVAVRKLEIEAETHGGIRVGAG